MVEGRGEITWQVVQGRGVIVSAFFGFLLLQLIKALIQLAKQPVNEVDANGRTCLHWAAEAGQSDMLNLLLEHAIAVGLNADAVDNAGKTWREVASPMVLNEVRDLQPRKPRGHHQSSGAHPSSMRPSVSLRGDSNKGQATRSQDDDGKKELQVGCR